MSYNLTEMSSYLIGKVSQNPQRIATLRCPNRVGIKNRRKLLVIASSTCVLLSLLMVGSSSAVASNLSTNLSSPTEQNTSNKSTALSKTSPVTSNTKGGHQQQHQQVNEQQVVIVDPQQTQSTDVSSMYVQIPIAEPSETGVPDGVQQTLTGEPDGGNTAGQDGTDGGQSKWTGPWPKKFQIGYIKQSDLHQVLIESLKGDTFTSLTGATKSSGPAPTGGSSTPAPATKSLGSASPASPSSAGSTKASSSSSDSSSLMSPAISSAASATNGQASIQQSSNSWPGYGQAAVSPGRSSSSKSASGNLYLAARAPIGSLASTSSVSHSNFPEQKGSHRQQLFQHHIQQQQQHRFPLASRQYQTLTSNHFAQNHQQHSQRHQHQQLQHHPLQQQQQQQFQFAGYPSSFAKNQPMYTINNFPAQEQQQQLDLTQQMPAVLMQQAQLPAFANHQMQSNGPQRGQKHSGDYYSSWRPVSTGSGETKFEHPSSAKPVFQSTQSEYGSSSFADDFDDGFTSPVRTEPPASLANMNRHPMLNNYLPSEATKAGSSSSSAPSGTGKTSAPSSSSTKSRTRGIVSAVAMATKGAARDPSGIKGGDSSVMNLPSSRRANGAGSNSTASPSDSSLTTSTTPSSSSTESGISQSSSTTLATSSSSSNAVTGVFTSTTLSSTEPSETTEPDSESIESETTEPSATTSTTGASGSTTTVATTTTTTTTTNSPAATTLPSGGMTTPLSAATADSRAEEQAEVSTQESRAVAGSGTSSLPSVEESTREETTPTSTSTVANEADSSGKAGGEVEGGMSDEALLAAAVRTGSEIGKSSSQQALSSRAKQTRSSERLQQQQRRNKTTGSSPAAKQEAGKKLTTGGTKSSRLSSSSGRASKQLSGDQLISKDSKPKATRRAKPTGKSNAIKGASTGKTTSNNKATRMVSQGQQQNERLQSAPQIVSMSAAQAQSTAQTLASLLLSRCMSSTSCSHLLDVCGTKQAAVPLSSIAGTLNNSSNSGDLSATNNLLTNSSAWSMPVGLPSSGLVNLAQALQADRVLRLFPQWKENLENLIDQSAQTGYTLILPSNEAIDRLPAGNLAHLQANSEALNQLIENHILDWVELIELVGSSQTHSGISRSAAQLQQQQPSRLIPSKGLQVNQHRERMVTINGKRLIYANQLAPAGGRIHVIDGLLDYPNTQLAGTGGIGNAQAKLLDIMDTLKQCDKFDGFVTLAEGTGLSQILKQDGPMTVFVPSNEALRKIPDEELEVIKNNSTALKEFLMYHVVNGSYFSQDLRDGQQLSSILDLKPIQVGVRVDGCSRRLVEANTSPMRRPDIVAKNGVIHILDWYLTVRDNEWCDPIGRSPAISSSPSETSSSSTRERLQQLASESSDAYATRLVVPANHKPVYSSLASRQLAAEQQLQVAAGKGPSNSLSSFAPTSDNEKAHNIFISATSSLDQGRLEKA